MHTHQKIRSNYWLMSKNMNMTAIEILGQKYCFLVILNFGIKEKLQSSSKDHTAVKWIVDCSWRPLPCLTIKEELLAYQNIPKLSCTRWRATELVHMTRFLGDFVVWLAWIYALTVLSCFFCLFFDECKNYNIDWICYTLKLQQKTIIDMYECCNKRI